MNRLVTWYYLCALLQFTAIVVRYLDGSKFSFCIISMVCPIFSHYDASIYILMSYGHLQHENRKSVKASASNHPKDIIYITIMLSGIPNIPLVDLFRLRRRFLLHFRLEKCPRFTSSLIKAFHSNRLSFAWSQGRVVRSYSNYISSRTYYYTIVAHSGGPVQSSI